MSSNFKNLKATMSLEKLNNFCKEIAEEYANSEPQFARKYFSNRYEITFSCFYKVLEYAVTQNLVEDIIVEKMMKKSITNQNLHKNGAGTSTVIKYAKMYTKRYKYIAEAISEKELKDLAIRFGKSPDIPKIEFASMYGVNSKVIDYALERAIKHNIVNDATVDLIEKRSIDNAKKGNVERVKKYFENLRKNRS